MKMPAMFKGKSLTRLAQGAAVGAVATMIVGFSWGGWVLGKTAENNATLRVNAALVQAYGPVCIERFKHQANVDAKWVEFTKVDAWRRDGYIRDSGFADASRLDIAEFGSRGCMCRRAQQNNRHADIGREVTSKRTVRCGSISRRGVPYCQSV